MAAPESLLEKRIFHKKSISLPYLLNLFSFYRETGIK